MNPISLSHLTVLDVGPPELITMAAEAGFKSVGIRLTSPIAGGIEYPLRPGSAEMKETLRRMSDSDVRVFDIEVVRLAPETHVQSYAETFEAGAELGAQRVGVNVDDPDRARTIDRFAELCDLAARSNLAVDLEFMIWRPVARLEDAVAIVTAAGRLNGTILVDALHLSRSGGAPAALASVDPALFGSMQICDAPKQAPEPSGIIDEARSDRLLPGDGDLPLRALLAALPKSIPIGVEIPMTRRHPTMSALERARRAYRATEAFLRTR